MGKDIDKGDNHDEMMSRKRKAPDSNHSKGELLKPPQYNFTRFCYRHNPENKSSPTKKLCYKQDLKRFSDFNDRISKLNRQEQSDVHNIISVFTKSNDKLRKLIFDGLLASSCFPQLSYVMSQVSNMIKIDFISTLPQEISLKILSYLDCQSLCNAAIVCRSWKNLADDDRVWYRLCEQHIDRKCPNCGWGLPLLHMKRARCMPPRTNINQHNGIVEVQPSGTSNAQNSIEDISNNTNHSHSNINHNHNNHSINNKNNKNNNNSHSNYDEGNQPVPCKTKPWKVIYRERYKVEYNWRKGNFILQEFKGHMDGVLTLQFNYRLLFTGSYDSTIAIWDLSTGKLLRRLTGNGDGVKTLHFDDQKLITGSLDKTIRVWNYVTGECISTYRGHTDSVMSIDSYKKIIVSGSADKTVKVWHIESRACYTLRGHTEWVNCVKLHPKSFSCFSCSDDTTIRMWDIRSNSCLKVFRGHVGQVQKVIPLTILDVENLVVDQVPDNLSSSETQESNDEEDTSENVKLDESLPYPTHLLSCSLDNTIKLWDVKTGNCIRTQFGHVEGVWDIAADNFRIISGSHDGTIKIWDLQSGKCMHTFAGGKFSEHSVTHVTNSGNNNSNDTSSNNEVVNTAATNTNKSTTAPPIACVGIGDSEFFCGDELGCVKMFRFDGDTLP
ncbi:hypothetical protein Kpol_1070p11 [Vanderwaltozyma polyspora DSM 70294]|uniref:F-box domain-containing protein n=1 Tax=Vanderwaltozyma polyspora (strain ATCC 22028 / DSM 70294 / BCRC 21397 / CBS 2163 / NBRC 10782 / NRRL Y-8283 / UCD 57-17) TaxID=436907 RepID=A7TNL2_VANPO|nr:uncharacterized protein Kpol_1070p11 [Vanderwaltozyma polyspora DSM 70294]EDO16129.1 hypothetical protein Kpol_1070p11 [Vanderwaltozyma polyspora DSM 70294]